MTDKAFLKLLAIVLFDATVQYDNKFLIAWRVLSLKEVYFHTRLCCIDKQFFFGNRLSDFVLHLGPWVDVQALRLLGERSG